MPKKVLGNKPLVEKQPSSGKERLQEFGKGLGWICVAVVIFIYSTYSMLSSGDIVLLVPGRGGLSMLLSGFVAWVHYVFYISFFIFLVTLSLDYFYKEENFLRNKVFVFSALSAVTFYVLTLSLFYLYGPDSDEIPRMKVFGNYYRLHGLALWSIFLFQICLLILILSWLPWKTKLSIDEKIQNLAMKSVIFFALLSSVLTLSTDRIDAWVSKEKKMLQEMGFKYDEYYFEKCIEINNFECVKLFLAAGMDINSLVDGQVTPVTFAIDKGHMPLVQFFLERNPDINKRGRKGWTPLQAAASSKTGNGCNEDLVLLLMKKGANVNAGAEGTHTALMRAVMQGCYNMTRIFLQNKADVNAREEFEGNTALHFAINAADSGSIALVKILLEHGADPNIKNALGETPLKLAKLKKLKEVVTLLQQYHARE